MGKPLEGVRIISLAHQYPGPYATLALSDLGAEVVIVERPEGGDPTRGFPHFHGSLNRGKRSVAIDLKDENGRNAFLALVHKADVLLEGFRPGTMDRLGLGASKLKEINENLVYVSISGFGQDGPFQDRPGHDLTYQAEAGMLYEHLAPAPLPNPPALALGDLSAGLFAVQGVLLGLLQCAKGAGGTYLDVSMFDCLVSMLTAHLGPVINAAEDPGFPYEPGYGIFPTADGFRLALGVAHEDHFWRRLCDTLGMSEDRDLGSKDRYLNHDRLRGRLREATQARTASELESMLKAADIPFGRLRTLEEMPTHPQARARGLFVELGNDQGQSQSFVRQPLLVDGVGCGPEGAVPPLGADTLSILEEAGIALPEILDLVDRGVVGVGDLVATNTSPESSGGLSDS